MSENKFIRHLQGKDTAKSVLEIRNQKTPTSFANMPDGTSNANDVYSDRRGDATGVLKGTENWKLDGQNLVETSTVYGDGRDLTSDHEASGNGLWVDATVAFATARRFNANTKFVLKLCGHDLETVINHTVDFTLIVKFGTSNLISKTFTVTEQAFDFCKEFVIDFAESNSSIIKADAGSTMQVQLLCADANARATIYDGMTVFTALQRRVDGDAVASDKKTFDEVVDDVEQLQEDVDDLEQYVDKTFVLKVGDTMSGALNIADIASSNTPLLTLTHSSNTTYKWNIATRYNSTTLSVYPGSTETNGFRFATTGFVPASNDARYLGSASLKWKGVYTGVINNGYDLVVPAVSGTLATKADVDLAANSGSQLYGTGVWYAKMYSATVVPTGAEYNDRNYADFSQVDRRTGKPIIVIYSCRNGVWAEVETIPPPDSYNGYITVTSKIWDITEQAGQQGGEILWSFERQRFTPYPKIVSFESINVTGDSTVVMPLSPTSNQIVNKDYVDTAISNIDALPDQTGHAGEYLTTDGSSASWAAINAGSGYRPDLFDWKWADHICNDVQWLRADTFSWQSGSVYPAAYKHLRNDMYNWYSWENNGTTIYTKKAYPEVGEKVYSDSALTTEVGEITAVTDTLDITVEKITVNGVVYDSVSGSNISPTTETIAGVTVQYIPAEDGHKIVTDFHISEVEAVYAATGVAWYYIIDYGSKRFKLPRTKFGFTGIRSGVGGYVEAGLPNITGAFTPTGLASVSNPTGCFSSDGSVEVDYSSATRYGYGVRIGFDASDSDSIYGNSDTVQPPATQMYLYFYVGEFTQTALENTAGVVTEDFNELNAHKVIAFQAPTAENNYTWYRKYADGWVEQGGITSGNGSYNKITVNLPVAMANTNYHTSCTIRWGNESAWYTSSTAADMAAITDIAGPVADITTTSFSIQSFSAHSWKVEGMAA